MGFFTSLNNLGFSAGMLESFLVVFAWGSLAGAIISAVGILIYRKIKYVYQGEIFKRRQDDLETGVPQSTIVSGIAGYFNKKGKTIFRIKYGVMPWSKIELTKLPDPKYMIGNKVYYLQLNKDNWVQAKLFIDWNGELKLEPVEDDLKYGAMLDIYEKDRVLEAGKLSPVVVGMMIMGLIIVSGIVVFYFLSKAG